MPFIWPAAVRRIMSRWTRQLSNMSEADDMQPFDWEWDERRGQYEVWWKLYSNEAYMKASDGGYREEILQTVIGREDYNNEIIAGYVNPVRTIVDCYQNVFRGVWGRDFWPMQEDGDEALASESLMYQTLSDIWRRSNLDTSKQLMQLFGPLYGTVGLRISANPETLVSRIQVEHPARIIDFDEDEDGNVTAVELQYSELTGPIGKNRVTTKVREILDKTRFIRERNGVNELDTPNALGVCPYVIIRHTDVGSEFGVPAFFGSETLLHLINWRVSRQNENIDQNEKPRWFVTGAGKAPISFDLGGTKALYAEASSEVPTPTATAMTPAVQHDQHRGYWEALYEKLKERQPEIVVSDIKALSGQSGETIAQLLKPVAERIELARANYEDGVCRALRLATAWRVLMGAADIGFGSGEISAAMRGMNETEGRFTFNERPALALSPYDLIKQAEAETARRKRNIEDANAAGTFVSSTEQLRIAGYSEEEIAGIESEVSDQDVIPTDDEDDVPFQRSNDAAA